MARTTARTTLAGTGSFLDQGRCPQLGETVWALIGQTDARPVAGVVSLISDIDRRGLGNTYLDVQAEGRTYHVPLMVVFNHRPRRVQIVDAFGPVRIWR